MTYYFIVSHMTVLANLIPYLKKMVGQEIWIILCPNVVSKSYFNSSHQNMLEYVQTKWLNSIIIINFSFVLNIFTEKVLYKVPEKQLCLYQLFVFTWHPLYIITF